MRLARLFACLVLISVPAVAQSVSTADSVATVVEFEGTCALQNSGEESFASPRLGEKLGIGSLVRTGSIGPNVVELEKAGQWSAIVGPGTTVVLESQGRLHLLSGRLCVTSKDTAVTVRGANSHHEVLKDETCFVNDREGLRQLGSTPAWLEGYRGQSGTALGSLMVEIDGRTAPLSIGVHKVTVDIRNQVARTTVEETFVNHTDAQLEGQFLFPLPPDASVSGFGMWVGDELVMADVVEKGQARRIFETLLREKRDPGLLEWSSGNLFRARVWPIPPHAHKRVRIVYTQLLPLEGRAFQYIYPLRSDATRANPISRIEFDITVESNLALQTVEAPNYESKVSVTRKRARVEFAATKMVPLSDYVVNVEMAEKVPMLSMTTHERDKVGYFMAQVTPPATSPAWPPEPVSSYVFLLDTSASMDKDARLGQLRFLEMFLTLVGDADVQVIACDTDCKKWRDGSVSLKPDDLDSILTFARDRLSLGWTDVSKFLRTALAETPEGGVVVYLGDGIPSGPEVETSTLVKVLGEFPNRRFSAVAFGPTVDLRLLQELSRQGNGTARWVRTSTEAPETARKVFETIVSPAWTGLSLKCSGVETEAVYPGEGERVNMGRQVVYVGRYRPETLIGEATCLLKAGTEPNVVQLMAGMSPPSASADSSYLPRLWAQRHLDSLLRLERTPERRDSIVALSAEFGIMTPLTSFIVLETEADRLRFGVKRRFHMRDGEEFFDAGRDAVVAEISRDEVLRARRFRQNLRSQALAAVSQMGRLALAATPAFNGYGRMAYDGLGGGGDLDGKLDLSVPLEESGAMDQENSLNVEKVVVDEPSEQVDLPYRNGGPLLDESSISDSRDVARHSSQGILNSRVALGAETAAAESAGGDFWYGGGGTPSSGESDSSRGQLFQRLQYGSAGPRYTSFTQTLALPASYPGGGNSWWVDSLFPTLRQLPAVSDAKEEEPLLSGPLMEELKRISSTAGDVTAVPLRVHAEYFSPSPYQNEWVSQNVAEGWWSSTGWLCQREGFYGMPEWEWMLDGDSGVVNMALGTARRQFLESNLSFSTCMGDVPPMTDWTVYYRQYEVQEFASEDGIVTAKLVYPPNPGFQVVLRIDTRRHLLLGVETIRPDQPSVMTRYEDYREFGGRWWPGRLVTYTSSTGMTGMSVISVEEVSQAELDQQVTALTDELIPALLDMGSGTPIQGAWNAINSGTGGVDDYLAALREVGLTQNWIAARGLMDALRKKGGDVPALRWLELAVEQTSGDYAALLEKGSALAGVMQDHPRWYDGYRGQRLLQFIAYGPQPNELVDLSRSLKSVMLLAPAAFPLSREWLNDYANRLNGAGRYSESASVRKELLKRYPLDVSNISQYVWGLINQNEQEKALAWLDEQLKPGKILTALALPTLRQSKATILERLGDMETLKAFTKEWAEAEPTSSEAHRQYLSALIRNGDTDAATKLQREWLESLISQKSLDPCTQARGEAAMQIALGQGVGYYRSQPEEQWVPLLVEASVRLLFLEVYSYMPQQILGNGVLANHLEVKKARGKILKRAIAQSSSLSMQTLGACFGALGYSVVDEERKSWLKLGEALEKRWRTEGVATKAQLGDWVLQGYANAQAWDKALGFLRTRLARATDNERQGAAQALFTYLLTHEPDQKELLEAALLIPEMGTDLPENDRIWTWCDAVEYLTQTVVAARRDQLQRADTSFWTRSATERQDKSRSFSRQAREELVALWEEVMEKEPRLAEWANLERIYLEMKLDSASVVAPVKKLWEEHRQGLLSDVGSLEMRRARRISEAMQYLAATGRLSQQEVTELVANLASLAHNRGAEEAQRQYAQLLTLLEKDETLVEELTRLASLPGNSYRWKVRLAFQRAESGRFKEALETIEGVKAPGALGADVLFAVANWRLLAGDQAGYEKALQDAYRGMTEYDIQRTIQADWNRRQSRGADEASKKISEDLRIRFRVLFEKSAYGSSYTWLLQQFYSDSRDPKLLGAVARGLSKQSPASAYPTIANLRYSMEQVFEEATVDGLIATLKEARRDAETAWERRLVDLFMVLVEFRVAQMASGKNPHFELARQGLERILMSPLLEGEAPQLAFFVESLPNDPTLKEIREKLLRHCYDRAQGKAAEVVAVGCSWAAFLRSTDRREEATELLIKVSNLALERIHEDKVDAAHAIQLLVSYSIEGGKWKAAEKWLVKAQLRRNLPASVRQTLDVQLFSLYIQGLSSRAEFVRGTGATLYASLEQEVRKHIESARPEFQSQFMGQYAGLMLSARNVGIPAAATDAIAFSKSPFWKKAENNSNYFAGFVASFANALWSTAGCEAVLEFAATRLEEEPDWGKWSYSGLWDYLGYQMGSWIRSCTMEPALEKRILAVTLDAIARDIKVRGAVSSQFYHKSNSWFWGKHSADFAAAALKVARESKDNGAIQVAVATYLWDGLDRRNDAIEVMQSARRRGVLDGGNAELLLSWLEQAGLWKEAVTLAGDLVKATPANLGRRTRLASDLWQAGQRAAARRTLKDARAMLERRGAVNHYEWFELGSAAVTLELWQDGAVYIQKAVDALRNQPGTPDGQVLQRYYLPLSQALSRSGKDDEAVEAAANAVVVSAGWFDKRQQAMNNLVEILSHVRKPARMVKQLAQEEAKSGMVNPTVHFALARMFKNSKKAEEANEHFKKALEVTPWDSEIRLTWANYLLEQGEKKVALHLLEQAVLDGYPAPIVYQTLEHLYQEMDRPRDAERARSAIIERVPDDPAGYKILGAAYEASGQWPKAYEYWKKAVKFNDMDRASHVGLARAALQTGHFEEASRQWEILLLSGRWPNAAASPPAPNGQQDFIYFQF